MVTGQSKKNNLAATLIRLLEGGNRTLLSSGLGLFDVEDEEERKSALEGVRITEETYHSLFSEEEHNKLLVRVSFIHFVSLNSRILLGSSSRSSAR